MRGRREDGDLLDEDQRAAADGEEDLTHAHVADVVAGGAEVDHQPAGEDVQRDGDPEEPFEAAGVADAEAAADQPDRVHEVEDGGDVSGLREAGVVDYLQVGGEVVGPAGVGDLVDHVDQAGADDGAVGEEVVWDEGLRGEPALVDHEADQDAESDDHHGDDLGRSPLVFGVAGDVEGGEEEDGAADHEEDADDYVKC